MDHMPGIYSPQQLNEVEKIKSYVTERLKSLAIAI